MGRTDIPPPDAERDVEVRPLLLLLLLLFIEKAETPALRMAMDAKKNFIFGGLIIFYRGRDENRRSVIFLDEMWE